MVSSASCSSANRSERSFGNDRGIAGIGLGFACVQIGDAAHGQSRQIDDEYAFIAGDGHRKRADCGGLIDDEQKSTVRLEFGDEGAKFGLVVGKRLVVQALAVPIECDGVMLAFTDIDADEDIDGVTLLSVLHRSVSRVSGLACNDGGKSGIHVTDGVGKSRPNPYQRSPATHQAQ